MTIIRQWPNISSAHCPEIKQELILSAKGRIPVIINVIIRRPTLAYGPGATATGYASMGIGHCIFCTCMVLYYVYLSD